jgi:peptidoglycan lytic transglycosylase
MTMRVETRRALASVIVLAMLAACGSSGVRDSAPSGSVSIPDLPGDAIPRLEDRSRYGNGPNYEVLGKHYTVMASGSGYSERGVASWYGKKFHGRLTSNREPYDMYAMTAAHKTLPLPTFVRVRNLGNNKSIIVRVNDRGPFVHNRIIDLSYVAALKLDMVRTGTSLVEVTAITFDDPPGDPASTRARQASDPRPASHRTGEPQTATPVGVRHAGDPRPAMQNKIYVQVGAFGSRENAERRSEALTAAHIGNVYIHADTRVSPTLYRVRIGPIHDVIQYDVIVEELENIGIPDPYLITELR